MEEKFKIEVKIGEIIPEHYGVSSIDYERQVKICYLIPFNLIVRVFNTMYFWLRFGSVDRFTKMTIEATYIAGYLKGKSENSSNR